MAVFNHTAHVALWDWLSENPDKQEKEWPEWAWNGGEYYDAPTPFNNKCFCCMYVDYLNESCNACPLVWPHDRKCGESNDYGIGLFDEWHSEADPQRRSELAAQIRDLPVREGVECI